MKTYKLFLLLLLAIFAVNKANAQQAGDSLKMIKGFVIAAPKPSGVAEFVKFINEKLAPRKVNTLILRIDFNYQYKSHPELRDSAALSKSDAKKILEACKKNGIAIIPQVNLLGHQSWAGKVEKLLEKYPD